MSKQLTLLGQDGISAHCGVLIFGIVPWPHGNFFVSNLVPLQDWQRICSTGRKTLGSMLLSSACTDLVLGEFFGKLCEWDAEL